MAKIVNGKRVYGKFGKGSGSAAFSWMMEQKRKRDFAAAAANPGAMKEAKREAYYASLPRDVAAGRKSRP